MKNKKLLHQLNVIGRFRMGLHWAEMLNQYSFDDNRDVGFFRNKPGTRKQKKILGIINEKPFKAFKAGWNYFLKYELEVKQHDVTFQQYKHRHQLALETGPSQKLLGNGEYEEDVEVRQGKYTEYNIKAIHDLLREIAREGEEEYARSINKDTSDLK